MVSEISSPTGPKFPSKLNSQREYSSACDLPFFGKTYDNFRQTRPA
jgi:hypothetical protein